MLKNIIFDWGGVIGLFNRDRIMRAFWNDPDDLARLKPILYRDWDAIDFGTRDYDGYVAQTLTLVPEADIPQVKNFFENWYKREAFPPLEDSWALVARLKARGYNCYLLSNAPTKFADGMDIFPVVRLFDDCIISACVKMHKPEKEIFLYALERFGVKPEETLFVDDVEANTLGARACGIDGYVFDGDADKLLKYIEEKSE